jgi:hypothetical protein
MQQGKAGSYAQPSNSMILPTENRYNYGGQIKQLISRRVYCHEPHISPRKAAFGLVRSERHDASPTDVDEAGRARFPSIQHIVSRLAPQGSANMFTFFCVLRISSQKPARSLSSTSCGPKSRLS